MLYRPKYIWITDTCVCLLQGKPLALWCSESWERPRDRPWNSVPSLPFSIKFLLFSFNGIKKEIKAWMFSGLRKKIIYILLRKIVSYHILFPNNIFFNFPSRTGFVFCIWSLKDNNIKCIFTYRENSSSPYFISIDLLVFQDSWFIFSFCHLRRSNIYH